MSNIYFSNVLKALPSVFLTKKTDVSLGGHSDLCITARSGDMLVRRLVADNYCQDRLIGGFYACQFIFKAMEIIDQDTSRSTYVYSPAELLEINDPEVVFRRLGFGLVSLFLLNNFFLELDDPSLEEDDFMEEEDYLEMPQIKCDRLTISSEPSGNHFKMCANIASSNDNPVVSLLTTEYGTIQIHASNDHEEYRAEIFLLGGEPPSRQAIGIPVALIDEVSYWIETGLHTESYLDIWFDENQVKFGTKTNQVLAKIEEYQPPKFDWQSETPTLIKEMSELDRQLLKSLLYQSSNEQLEWDTPRYYAPLIEFYQTVEHLFMRMSSYQQNVQTVSVGITELRDFVEYLDITQEALNLKVEVNAKENYVIFFGDSPCQESEALVHFGYFILGVLPDTQKGKGVLDIAGDEPNQALACRKREEWVDWTREHSLTIEGIKFIERFPLDFRTDSSATRNSKQWQSLSKNEPPFNNLIKIIKDLQNEIKNLIDNASISVVETLQEEMKDSKLLSIETLAIVEIFKSKYPSDYHNYSLLAKTCDDLNNAVNQTKPKMFDPEATNTLIQTLETLHKEAQWVYFTFLNEYYWGNENPRLWQQTFDHCPTVDDFETAIAAQVNRSPVIVSS